MISTFLLHRDYGNLAITVVDVGQGDGIVIKTDQGKFWLVDCGSSDVSDVWQYRMKPYLKSQGVAEIEYVFATHGDMDHINGIEKMLLDQEFSIHVKNLVLPVWNVWDESLNNLADLAGKLGTRVLLINRDEKLCSGKSSLRCLFPDKESGFSVGNESSLVLLLEYEQFSMLLTGDLEGHGEEMVADTLRETTIDALKVAHHGSNQSTTDEFLEVIHPKIALISAGRNNRYHHPGAFTIDRLRKSNVDIYSTQEYGAITIRVKGGKMRVDGYLRPDQT